MGWSHPDISREDLLVLIKGFVDILILACGYQSSGLPATWDVDNIKKAVNWGLFFEDVFKRLRGTVYFEDSVKELDAALLDLTSESIFPPGLVHMSSATLSTARDLILEHLLQTHPLKDAHLSALLTAIIEMDINNLTKTDDDGPNIYIDRLMLQIESLNLVPARKGSIKDSTASSPTIGLRIRGGHEHRVCDPKTPTESYVESEECILVDHSPFIIQELIKRQELVACISSIETSLDTLSKIITRSSLVGSENNPPEGKPHNGISSEKEEMLTELCLWNQWRSRCLSYLLDKRTIRLLSGANLIFSAPKVQWIRVFEPLNISVGAHNDSLLEIMEILLLGFISSRWSILIEHFISQSCDFLSISKQYLDLHRLLQGNSQSLHSKKEAMNSKEKDILEYLTQLLVTQPHKLWQVPPVLAAAAVPSRSILFRMYLSDIEGKFNEASSSSIRCCGCSQDGKEHRNCEIAERIRCLYVFHIQGSHLMVDDCSA